MQRRLFLTTIGATAAAPALAQRNLPNAPNPQIDYGGFERLTGEVRRLRAQRLLPFARFKELAARADTCLLDARSEAAFREGHIKGAANLPLPDFNAVSLHALIGAREQTILIYCNNNFSNHRRPVPVKAAPLALNIQTFINLVGYGYANVWELADVIDFDDPKVEWVAA